MNLKAADKNHAWKLSVMPYIGGYMQRSDRRFRNVSQRLSRVAFGAFYSLSVSLVALRVPHGRTSF